MGYEERFAAVKERLARKQHLEAVMPDLQNQYSDVLAKVMELREQKTEEQKDVDRLEHGSLAAFLLNVVGKKEEKLAKEQREAYMAAVKCDAAEKELADVEERLQRAGEELAGLQNCEKEYEALLKEKREEIERRGLPAADEIMKTEQNLFFAEKQLREIKEAISEGEKAEQLAEAALGELDSADSWSTFDLFGGGLLADMAKHDKIDEAQELIESLQRQLRSFKTELTDVHIDASITINISEMLKFADYFFDGFFADYEVKHRIEDSMEQVEETKEKIVAMLRQLNGMLTECERKQAEYKERLRSLIRQAEV